MNGRFKSIMARRTAPLGHCQRVASLTKATPRRRSGMIGHVLDNPPRRQPAATACVHEAIIEEWMHPPLKPNGRRVVKNRATAVVRIR
jgi:hypothetical protein